MQKGSNNDKPRLWRCRTTKLEDLVFRRSPLALGAAGSCIFYQLAESYEAE
jgi:hypothetical protein